jgi:hypothetical protein
MGNFSNIDGGSVDRKYARVMRARISKGPVKLVTEKEYIFVPKGKRSSVAESIIGIEISSDAISLENLANTSVERMGKLISLDIDYRKIGGDVTMVRLRIRPEDVGKNIYETLVNVTRRLSECVEYKKICEEIDIHGRFLEDVVVGGINLSRAVGEYLREAYEYTEGIWEITRQDVCSNDKGRRVTAVRHAIFYAMRKKFSSGSSFKRDGTRLSSNDIATIMGGKNHATVLLGCKRIEEALKENGRMIDNFDSVSDVVRKVVDVLGVDMTVPQ